MFPHVHADDGSAFGTGDGFAHERAVLVGGGDDFELLAGSDDEPSPTATETSETGGFELRLEVFDAAELLLDGFGEFARGFATVGTEEVPEEGVVGVSAAVVTDRTADGFRHSGEVGDEVVDRLAAEFRSAFEGLVEIRHVRGMMLVVMDLHRLRVDAGLQSVVGIGQWWKFVGHSGY